MSEFNQTLISAVRIKKLFGLYSYNLPSKGSLQDAAIFYGDNGAGKSTILRLAFHMLSAADNRGHRKAIYEVEFSELEVDLASGITVRASRKPDDPLRLLNLRIMQGSQILAEWDYRPKSGLEHERERLEFQAVIGEDGVRRMLRRKVTDKKPLVAHPRGETAFIETLRVYAPTVFILNSDRRLDSDAVPNPSDEIELRKLMRFEESRHINDLVRRSREIALSQAMSSAGLWVSKKALQGANQGSTNVHSVYTDVLHKVMQRSSMVGADGTKSDSLALIDRLNLIEERTLALSLYELATQLPLTPLYKALKSRSSKSSVLAVELLKPYIASLEGRLNAVEPIYRVIDRFVTIVNKFLSDKTLSFRLSQGFTVQNTLGTMLGPAQLSSGEQQLFLLFYYVLTAREKPSIFMIDEPEISLNIKWQRRLVQSLLDITDGASTQFIFASHSMELLAQHRSRVTRLESIA